MQESKTVGRKEVACLVGMAALWGASFAFQRQLVPVFGPMPNTLLRLGFATLALWVWRSRTGGDMLLKKRWKLFLGLGLLSSAVPYTLFAYGALSLPTAILAVLNGTAPIFGAALSAVFLKEKLTWRKAGGLGCATLGVAIVSDAFANGTQRLNPLGIGACLVAALCYAGTGILVSKKAPDVPAIDLAVGGQGFGALAMVPLAAITWPDRHIPGWTWPTSVVFAVFCSAAPYLMYWWLNARVGVTRALTVTFLIPLFGALWGALLGEGLSAQDIIGSMVIFIGVYLVVRKS